MPSKRRPARQQTQLPATSLEEQARKLEEDKRRIAEEMRQCEEFLRMAPEIKREQAKRLRDELVRKRATGAPQVTERRRALPDTRYIHSFNAEVEERPRRSPRLRKERSQGRLTFFLLLFALVIVLGWAYSTFASR